MIGNRNHTTHSANQSFYTFDWEDAGWTFGSFPPYNHLLEKPDNLDLMYSISRKLSNNMKYIRVDLYEINRKIYFGELTFYPLGGFHPYNDVFTFDTDKMLGRFLDLYQ